MTKEFYFLRHGQTDWNKLKLCQGQEDIALNQQGLKQAQKAAELTKDFSLKTILYSPLIRAKDTAFSIAQKHPEASLIPCSELMERAWGLYEGESSEKMYDYEQRESTQRENLEDLGNDFEIKEVFRTRVERALEKVLSEEAPIMVVSHGRLFNMLCEVLSISPPKQLQNARPVRFSYHDQLWQLTLFDEDEATLKEQGKGENTR